MSTIFDAKEVLELSALGELNQPTVSQASPADTNVKSNSVSEKSTQVTSRNRDSNRNRHRLRTAKRARRRLRASRKILHTTFPESRSKLLY